MTRVSNNLSGYVVRLQCSTFLPASAFITRPPQPGTLKKRHKHLVGDGTDIITKDLSCTRHPLATVESTY